MPHTKKNQSDHRPAFPVYEFSDEFLDETIAIWQPRYGDRKKLTREDAREIATNLVGFFRILQEWGRAEKAQASSTEANSKSEDVFGEGGTRIRTK